MRVGQLRRRNDVIAGWLVRILQIKGAVQGQLADLIYTGRPLGRMNRGISRGAQDRNRP
jgi:hypothetical protein